MDHPTTGISCEEAARAEVYGVLAALFFAPPEPALLDALRGAAAAQPDRPPDSELEAAWGALAEAARSLAPRQIADEFDALFGGVGKPDIHLFGSHYLSGFLHDKPLASLRSEFARLGIARSEGVHESEDHFACLCDAMRCLIGAPQAGAGEAATLEDQAALFERHVAPWAEAMCDAVAQHPRARFYAQAAAFARAFVAVERQAFEMFRAERGG